MTDISDDHLDLMTQLHELFTTAASDPVLLCPLWWTYDFTERAEDMVNRLVACPYPSAACFQEAHKWSGMAYEETLNACTSIDLWCTTGSMFYLTQLEAGVDHWTNINSYIQRTTDAVNNCPWMD